MENAVKRFQGHIRVLKHYFESKIKRELKADCAMFTWLVVWAAESLNKFKVGSDGLTCYERITKHKCSHETFGFGESIIWQMAPDKTSSNKLDSEFCDGILLGVVWRSGKILIGTRVVYSSARREKHVQSSLLMIPSVLIISLRTISRMF